MSEVIFHDQLLNKNGDTGQAYRMTSPGERPLDSDTFDAVRDYAVWRGRGNAAVLSCVEITAVGEVPIMKVKPEFTPEELKEMSQEGVKARPIIH